MSGEPTWRDVTRQVSPPWLATGNNEKLLYAWALHLDIFSDMLAQGIGQRMPGLIDFQSLKTLGRERRIPRGTNETDEAYASRLRGWLDAHRHRGGPYALLEQLFLHYSPVAFPIDLIYRNGRRFRMAADGTVTMDTVAAWNPTGVPPEQWATVTLIYYTSIFGASPSADTIADIKAIPEAWSAAHILGTIILTNGGEFFDATDPSETFDGGDALFDSPATSLVTIPYGAST